MTRIAGSKCTSIVALVVLGCCPGICQRAHADLVMRVLDSNFNARLVVDGGNKTWSTAGSFKDVGASHAIMATSGGGWHESAADFSITPWYGQSGFSAGGNAWMFNAGWATSDVWGFLKFDVPDQSITYGLDLGGSYGGYSLKDLTTGGLIDSSAAPSGYGTLFSGHTYELFFHTFASSSLNHTAHFYFSANNGTIVPVPGAVLLGMLGLGVAGIKLRKHER